MNTNNLGRTKEETKRLTSTAFWELIGGGVQPTVDYILEWFEQNEYGRRNRNVISEQLKECWKSLGSKVKGLQTIPGLPEETVNLFLSLRDHMEKNAKQAFEKDVADIQANCDALLEAGKKQVAELNAVVDSQRRAAAELEALNEKLTVSVTAANDALLAEQQELIAARALLENIREQLRDALSRNEILSHDLAAEKEAGKIALQVESERYTSMHKSLMLQLDVERSRQKVADARSDKLAKKIDDLNGELVRRDAAHNDLRAELNQELGKEKGLVIALQARLVASDNQLALRSAELLSANALHAARLEEVASLQKKIDALAGISVDVLQEWLSMAYEKGVIDSSVKKTKSALQATQRDFVNSLMKKL